MEKRVIIAFALSFVVIYAFTALYSPKPATQPVPTTPVTAPPPPPKPAEVQNVPPRKSELPPSDTAQDVRSQKMEETSRTTSRGAQVSATNRSLRIRRRRMLFTRQTARSSE